MRAGGRVEYIGIYLIYLTRGYFLISIFEFLNRGIILNGLICRWHLYLTMCHTPFQGSCLMVSILWCYCVQGIAFRIIFGRVNTHREAMYLTLQNWGLQKIGCWPWIFFRSCSEGPNREKVGELRGNHNPRWLSGTLSLNLTSGACFSVIKHHKHTCDGLECCFTEILWYIGHSWS